jgi:hypothetical protein
LPLCVTKLGRFRRSTACVGFGKEKEDYAPAAKVGERKFGALIGFQAELWSFVANLQHGDHLEWSNRSQRVR